MLTRPTKTASIVRLPGERFTRASWRPHDPGRDDRRYLVAAGGSERIEPLTVLLIDDDSSTQTILYQLLEEGGYNVLAAGNGMDALDICRQCRHPIDLLLTDVEMPGMSGFDLAAHAVRLQPLMKVLFMSGDADNGTPRREGFQDVRMCLAKPFDQAALMGKVRMALRC